MRSVLKQKPDCFQAACEAQQEWRAYAKHVVPVLNRTDEQDGKDQAFAGSLVSNFQLGFLIAGIARRTGMRGNRPEVHGAARRVMGDDAYEQAQTAMVPSIRTGRYPSDDMFRTLEEASVFMDFFLMGRDESNRLERNVRRLASAMTRVLSERLVTA